MHQWIWLVIVLFIFVVIVIWWCSTPTTVHDHRKHIAVIYDNQRPSIPDQLEELADVSYLQLTRQADDLDHLIELEDVGVDLFISELSDEDVFYLHQLYFHQRPEILHLNNGSRIAINDVNLIRTTISDKYLVQAIHKYTEGITSVAVIPGSTNRAKILEQLLNYPIANEQQTYDLVISLGPTSQQYHKIMYILSDEHGLNISAIEEDSAKLYNLAYMLSKPEPRIKIFQITNGKQPIAHLMLIDDQSHLFYHRLIDEIDHVLNSK